jgi:transglutaminase-like putative cysteine protease
MRGEALAPSASQMGRQEFATPSVLTCGLAIFAVKLALRVRGFGRTIRWIRRRVHPIAGSNVIALDAVRVAGHTVAMAGALYPGRAMCLEQSLVLYYLLRRQGVPIRFVMGVQPRPFGAHAWVEYEGTPVNDVPEHVTWFTRLPHSLP